MPSVGGECRPRDDVERGGARNQCALELRELLDVQLVLYRKEIGLEQLIGADPDIYVATGGTHLAKTGGLVLGLGVGEADAAASFGKLLATPALATLSAIEKRRAFGFWHLFNDTPLHVVAIELLAKWFHPERFADIDPAATLAEGARFSAIPLDGTLWIAAPKA